MTTLLTLSAQEKDTFKIVAVLRQLIEFTQALDTEVTTDEAELPLPVGAATNYSISVAAASNNLTITINDRNGTTPTATSPIVANFRSTTLTSGITSQATSTAALTFTINSTKTLGTVSNQPFKIHLVLFNNAGTLVLSPICCVVGGATPTKIVPIDSSALQSTDGNANGGTTAGVYGGSTLTSLGIAYLGYLECNSTSFTAGTWGTTTTGLISRIVKWYPGMRMPGDLVQEVRAVNNTTDTTTSATFVATADNRITITPTSVAHAIDLLWVGTLASSNAAALNADAQWSRGTVANTNMIGTLIDAFGPGATANSLPMSVIASDLPNTASAQTYTLQIRGGATIAAPGANSQSTAMRAREIAT